MKKLFFFLTLSVFIFGGCDPEGEGDKKITIKVIPNEPIEFTYLPSNQTITIVCNGAWTASAESDAENWLRIDNLAGSSGEAQIKISAPKNATNYKRNGTVTIRAGKNTKETINVSQDKQESSYTFRESFFYEFDEMSAALIIESNDPDWTCSVVEGSDWLEAEKNPIDGGIDLTLGRNTTSAIRKAVLEITESSSTYHYSITQWTSEGKAYLDGEVLKLKSATALAPNAKGVNIVMVGDGYTQDLLVKGTGKYERDMRGGMDAFFSVYPYDEYAKYFNVYMIGAVSQQNGISIENSTYKDTRFSCIWEGPSSTGIECDYNAVIQFVKDALDITDQELADYTVIMPVNADIYAGTCYMFNNFFSISMCPVGSYFEEIIVHEAGGHGFGKLCDEYIYNDETITSEYKNILQEWKSEYGYYANVDFYSNIRKTSWKEYADMPKYTTNSSNGSPVGTFEGAYMYKYGIWRAEDRSCMDQNIPYFNAPSRWAQVQNISRIAGLGITFQDYTDNEVIPKHPDYIRSKAGMGVTQQNKPLGMPKMKDSWF